MSMLTLRIDDKLDQQLNELSKATGKSRSDIAREAIKSQVFLTRLEALRAKGVPMAQARAHEPSVHTLALTGYNYWAADRRHPCSALGMLYALEVIASVYGGPFASAIKEVLLLDGDRGVSFIDSHATLDAKHMSELRQIINRLPDDHASDAVVESVKVNFHHFTRIIEAI